MKRGIYPRISVIILLIVAIAVFSIAGIIACSGDTITGGRSRGYYSTTGDGDPTNTGPSDTNTITTNAGNTNAGSTNTNASKPPANTVEDWDNDPDNNKYPANTYYNLYTPFTGNNYRKVSYQNTNKLTKIWQKTIEGGEKNISGQRWFIRDGNNYYGDPSRGRTEDPRKGNYYYFDKNFDIVYVHNEGSGGKYTVKVKKFLFGVIIDYCKGDGKVAHDHYGRGDLKGQWVVGGLYETALNKTKDSLNGGKGYTDYNNDYLNIFMHARHNRLRDRGHIEIIVMNVGWSDKWFKEFGLDSYYSTLKNYNENLWLFLGQNPNTYTYGQTPSRLNWRVHLAWVQGWGFDDYDGGVYKGYSDNYKFFTAETYDWHLK